MAKIIENSFYQLMVVYSLVVILIALGTVSRFALQFHIFAFIIALFGISIISKKELDDTQLSKKLHYLLFTLAILFIIFLRFLPYLINGFDVPLGYDAGLYKYGIESDLDALDQWILNGGMEPGFLYLMKPLTSVFSTDFILVWLLIAFSVILGVAIYLFSREYFNKEVALVALIIFALSLVQIKVFAFMYYKNIIGLSLMLFSLYFLRRYESNKKTLMLVLFIVLAGFLGAVHRPTFYIFGLSYFFYAFLSPWKDKKYDLKRMGISVLSGVIILIISSSFYIGEFWPAITSVLPYVGKSFISPGESPGTFISFINYQLSVLPYLVLSLIGLFYLIKKRQASYLVIWTLINLAIVYFQFFFFNRFIIHLDIALIILSAIGFALIFQDMSKRKLVSVLMIVLLVSAGFLAFKESVNAKPSINDEDLLLLKKIPEKVELDASIISISSQYSPFVLAYSERKTIAPGLFDENIWTEEQWDEFWESSDENETKELLSSYNKPLYLFSGMKEFNNPCFEEFLVVNKSNLLKYVC